MDIWFFVMCVCFGLVLYASIYTDYQNLSPEEKDRLKKEINDYLKDAE